MGRAGHHFKSKNGIGLTSRTQNCNEVRHLMIELKESPTQVMTTNYWYVKGKLRFGLSSITPLQS